MCTKREKSPLNIYHIYNRGNNKENIFIADEEKRLFISFMNEHIKETYVSIHCLSIMINHYHYVLEGSLPVISSFMKIVQEKYAKHYNMWHNRTGHVFQGRFGSNPVFTSKQYIDLYRYVSLNAVKAGITTDPYSYEWCSINPNAKIINITSDSSIQRFFKLEGVSLENHLKDRHDERISRFDIKKFTSDEAREFFCDQLIRYNLHNTSDFLDSSFDVIEKVLKTCRYHGITIKQLQDITGLSYQIIRTAAPESDEYI